LEAVTPRCLNSIVRQPFSSLKKTNAGQWERTTTRRWDVATGKSVGLPLEYSSVNSVNYSPNGKTALTGGGGGARLWDATTGSRRKNKLFSNSNRVHGVAYSPDGKTILTGDAEPIVRLWDGAGNQRIVEPMKHMNIVLCVVYSGDGRTILT
jgi:WD40 repeat protein